MTIRIQRASKPIEGEILDIDGAGDDADEVALEDVAAAPHDTPKTDQIVALIPGAASALYLAGIALIPAGNLTVQIIWLVIGLVFAIIVASNQKNPEDPTIKLPTEWNQVAVTAGAFLVWTYALGGPYETADLYLPYLASLLILAYTAFTPYVLEFLDRVNP